MESTLERSEISAARSLHRQIKALLKTQERGEATEKTLQELKTLSDGLVQAVGDPFCQQKTCEVERLADELFYVDKRSRWGRTPQPGIMLLRRLVYRALDALDERLRSLEKLQRSASATMSGSGIGAQ
jgi:hypothetical protein